MDTSSKVLAVISAETISPIAKWHAELGKEGQPFLLGYVMSLGYDEGTCRGARVLPHPRCSPLPA